MNIDFHYGVIYLVSRLSGLNSVDAETVAHACQYVDDATIPGILEFAGGETFDRIASAHEMFDYKNILDHDERIVWVPFHFLPGGEGESFEQKSICRPDSKIARAMVQRAIDSRKGDNALHRLGVTLHVYVDTWAHQGFSGTMSQHNNIVWLEGDDHDEKTWREKLAGALATVEENIASRAIGAVSIMGHGCALHFPDMPWASWRYRNGLKQQIERQNLPDFLQAADMAARVIQAFQSGNGEFWTEPGLELGAKQGLEHLMGGNKDLNPKVRLEVVRTAAVNGLIPGVREEIPIYVAKGHGSWKHRGTGLLTGDDGAEKPVWTEEFETSDYRRFHDAVKEHRFEVTQHILPEHGVRLA